MIKIGQGKPYSGYFKIFQAINEPAGLGQEVVCIHPKSHDRTKGVIEGIFTEKWIDIPDWICLDTYGVTASELKARLENSFEQHRNQDLIRILLIKQN